MGVLYFFSNLIARAGTDDTSVLTRSREDAFYNRYMSADAGGVLRTISAVAVAGFVFTTIGQWPY